MAKEIRKEAKLPERFIFRQVYYGDLRIFLSDGEVRSKNHALPQLCHQTSYQSIVDRRNTDGIPMPCGGVVNDYVPFYFSPLTSFTYTIYLGNVPLRGIRGEDLGFARAEDRVFLVCKIAKIASSDLQYCFSDLPLNSGEDLVEIMEDISSLEEHVNWNVFDDYPMIAHINEIGYRGVCKYFQNSAQEAYSNRSKQRMAEFLIKDALPMEMVECIVVQNKRIGDRIQAILGESRWRTPVYIKAGCYF